jgi:peptidyl-prolyl cis-trans isomerase C
MKSSGKKVVVGLCFMGFVLCFFLWSMKAWTEAKEEQVLAKVGNYIITQADFDEITAKYQGLKKDQPFSAEEKKNMLDSSIKMALIVQEAERLQLDKKAAFETKMKIFKTELLMREYVSFLIEPTIKVTDADVEDYLKQSPNLIPRETLSLREIVVKEEKEAREIKGELKKGVPFSKLATEKSIAPSKRNGGRIGQVTRGKLPPPVEEAAFKLKVGEFSEPIKTDQGYTILYLDERKERTQKEMDELMGKVKIKIAELLKTRKIEGEMEKKVQELSSHTKIEKYYERIK